MSKLNHYRGVLYILLHSGFDVIFYVACQNSSEHKKIASLTEEVIFVFFYNLKSFILLIVVFTFLYLKSPLHYKLNRQSAKFYLYLSFFSVIGFIIFLYSLKYSMIANAMSLKYTEQLYWLLIGLFIFKEKLSNNQLQGIVTSFFGVIILISVEIDSSKPISAYLFPLIAAAFWAISSNIGKYIIGSTNSIILHMIYYYFFHLIILVVIIILQIAFIQGMEHTLIIFGSYEFLFQILSMLFFYKALKLAPISILAPFVYIKIILSVLIGYLFLNNIYSLLQLASYCLFIIGGLKIFSNLYDKTKLAHQK